MADVQVGAIRCLVTGANGGLGFETCAQLVKLGVGTVVVGCRTQAKADKAVEQLAEQTGAPASSFDTMVIDTSSNASCEAAVAALVTPLDWLILNAGGIGATPQNITDSGAACLFAQNIVGHAVLVEGLIAAGTLNKGGRVVLSGSEQARGNKNLGQKRPPVGDPVTAETLESLINATGLPDFNNQAYASAKCIGALYIASLARKNPEYYMLTVSPGGTSGTNIFAFLGCLGCCLSCCLKCMGTMHDLSTGAGRYINAITTPSAHASGQFIATQNSGKQTGPVGDQAEVWGIFADETAQEAAFTALHKFMGPASGIGQQPL